LLKQNPENIVQITPQARFPSEKELTAKAQFNAAQKRLKRGLDKNFMINLIKIYTS